MSSPFFKFLAGQGNGLMMKSYAHASGLYVNGNMKRAPKLGFLYFVSFRLNNAALDENFFNSNGSYDVGLLVKKADLPKFKATVETINQYNRKTNIQTKLTYDPITIEFHDDNSEITNNLWVQYYKYYFKDSNYHQDGSIGNAFSDTKFDLNDYRYGLDNFSVAPFFKAIDIFVLHQGRFTQVTFTNPIISSWEHDSVDQTVGNKTMTNRMTISYDSVGYNYGKITESEQAGQYKANYYDNLPGPNAIVGTNKLVAPEEVFGSSWTPTTPKPYYPSPPPAGSSLSELGKNAAQQGSQYTPPLRAATSGALNGPTPRPIGAGTFGLGQRRPGGFGISGINVWYGHGGLHGRAVINAGPIRLVLKK